mmetsp:Transcript_68939/g.223464  ORF Transcript_68939/g.223464 Transcript_68939/m.223464 type:complete len:344 (-) Transcript_68939:138-1169(-)
MSLPCDADHQHLRRGLVLLAPRLLVQARVGRLRKGLDVAQGQAQRHEGGAVRLLLRQLQQAPRAAGAGEALLRSGPEAPDAVCEGVALALPGQQLLESRWRSPVGRLRRAWPLSLRCRRQAAGRRIQQPTAVGDGDQARGEGAERHLLLAKIPSGGARSNTAGRGACCTTTAACGGAGICGGAAICGGARGCLGSLRVYAFRELGAEGNEPLLQAVEALPVALLQLRAIGPQRDGVALELRRAPEHVVGPLAQALLDLPEGRPGLVARLREAPHALLREALRALLPRGPELVGLPGQAARNLLTQRVGIEAQGLVAQRGGAEHAFELIAERSGVEPHVTEALS